jgi:hypothetical protein
VVDGGLVCRVQVGDDEAGHGHIVIRIRG